MKAIRIALLGLATTIAAFAQAQTVDEVVNKHLEAIGGAENWKKINSMSMEGVLTVQGSIQVNIKQTVLHQKGMRLDFNVMGQDAYQIMTPTGGWSYMPFQGQTKAEPMTEDQVKDGADDIDAQGNLIDYQTKGHKVALVGKEDVDGVETHKLQVTLKGGKVLTYFVDPKTFYIVKMVMKQNVNGQEMEMASGFSNYKKLPEGIVVPMNMTRPEGELVVSKYEFNKPVDENIFKPTN